VGNDEFLERKVMSGKIRGERDCSWGRAWTPIFGSSAGRERRAATLSTGAGAVL